MVNVNLPVELGRSYNCVQCKKLFHKPCFIVASTACHDHIFAAFWWSRHIVCMVSSDSFTTVKMSKKKIARTFYTRTARLNEHTKIIMVNIVAALVKQPSGNILAISETKRCRATKFGEVIETSNGDDTTGAEQ